MLSVKQSPHPNAIADPNPNPVGADVNVELELNPVGEYENVELVGVYLVNDNPNAVPANASNPKKQTNTSNFFIILISFLFECYPFNV